MCEDVNNSLVRWQQKNLEAMEECIPKETIQLARRKLSRIGKDRGVF